MKLNGSRVYFENGKVLFIDGPHHVNNQGAEDYGRQMNIDEESYFLNMINGSKVPTVYESLSYGLEESIKKLKDIEATAIILDNNLLNINGFKSLIKESDSFPRYSYNDIPIFTVNNNKLRRSFILANFEKAFTMLYRSNKNLLDDELKVEVYEVTKDIVQEKLSQMENLAISTEDKKNKIMSSVIIEFEVIIDFKIDNIGAYTIGYVDDQMN